MKREPTAAAIRASFDTPTQWQGGVAVQEAAVEAERPPVSVIEWVRAKLKAAA